MLQPEVYAASDVSQATIDITAEWVDKAIGLLGQLRTSRNLDCWGWS